MKKLITLLSCMLLMTACLDRLTKKDGDPAVPTPTPGFPQSDGNPTSSTVPASSQQPETDDHQVGNGGGGVCVGGSCVTLTEAGLRVTSPVEEYYILPSKIVRAVADMTERLPVGEARKEMMSLTVGKGKTFKIIDVADPQKLEIIRKRYAKVLASYNPSIDMADVKIFAFAGRCDMKANPSNYDYCTYLLPDFFKLDLSQQAKVLLHETNVRAEIEPEAFLNVLEFDGLMEDLLNDPNLFMDSSFRMDRWVELLGKFGEMNYPNHRIYEISLAAWFAWLETTKGLVFESAKISKSESPHFFKFDQVLLASNYEVPPAFARVLDLVFSMKESASYDLRQPEISPADVEKICKEQLQGQTYASVFHAYQKQDSPDYELVRISCLVKNGVLSSEARLCTK